MSGVNMTIKTNDALLTRLTRSVTREPTPHEIFEQRVSFVYGSMNPESSVTREQVKQIILKEEGIVEGS